MRRLLAHSRAPERADKLLSDAGLTGELAWSIRQHAGADLGLALHGILDPGETAENLAKGRTVISITDGSAVRSRTYESTGRGVPDRTRMSINALELVRMALIEGLE